MGTAVQPSGISRLNRSPHLSLDAVAIGTNTLHVMAFPFSLSQTEESSSLEDRLPVLLVSTFDRGVARRVVVDALPFRIGSGAECNLRLSAVTVSRLHAQLLWRDGRLFLRDAGSLNGTFVDGERVSESPLEDQQRVRVGPFQLQLRWVSLDGVVEPDATATFGAA